MSMALSLHLRCFSLRRHNNYLPPSIIRRCTTTLTRAASSNSYETRRSANYKPNTWDYDLLESLPTNNDEMKKKHIEEREKMIAEEKGVLSNPSMDSLRRLELVDAVDRLGLKRHFQQEIEVACVVAETGDLHTTAVRFRLLRQHGYPISEAARQISELASFHPSLSLFGEQQPGKSQSWRAFTLNHVLAYCPDLLITYWRPTILSSPFPSTTAAAETILSSPFPSVELRHGP